MRAVVMSAAAGCLSAEVLLGRSSLGVAACCSCLLTACCGVILWSITLITAWSTEVKMRIPPGSPTAKKGDPSG
jgi:hypothetical protein